MKITEQNIKDIYNSENIEGGLKAIEEKGFKLLDKFKVVNGDISNKSKKSITKTGFELAIKELVLIHKEIYVFIIKVGIFEVSLGVFIKE